MWSNFPSLEKKRPDLGILEYSWIKRELAVKGQSNLNMDGSLWNLYSWVKLNTIRTVPIEKQKIDTANQLNPNRRNLKANKRKVRAVAVKVETYWLWNLVPIKIKVRKLASGTTSIKEERKFNKNGILDIKWKEIIPFAR